jgi:hypothetical protein
MHTRSSGRIASKGFVSLSLVLAVFAGGCKRSKADGGADGGSSKTGSASTTPASTEKTAGQLLKGDDLVPFDLPAAGSTATWTAVKLGNVSWSVPPGYTTTDKLVGNIRLSLRYRNPKEPGVTLIVRNYYDQALSDATTTGALTSIRANPARKAVRIQTLAGVAGVLSWMAFDFEPTVETFAWEVCRNVVKGYCEHVGATLSIPKGSADNYKQLFADVLSTFRPK